MIAVKYCGVVHGVTALLPLVVGAGAGSGDTEADTEADTEDVGAVVITGSKQGITNPPGNVAYNASKAAVRALAEHLSWDLRSTRTTVHLLVPGWTYTGLSGNRAAEGTAKPTGAWWPQQVVDLLERRMA